MAKQPTDRSEPKNRLGEEMCPKCGISLQGDPIPEEHRQYYGGKTRFSLKVGIEEHDRVVRWRCSFCGHEWPNA